jgi:tetratricopeptide (TPR) repeat protein
LLGLATIALRQGDQEAALAYLRAATEADPASSEALRQLALLLEQRQQYEELVTVYERMTELTPDDPNLRVAQATVLARLGQVDSAVASLQAVQALDPYRQYAWLNVAAAASGSRQYEAAIIIATAGLEAYPDSVSLLITRGLAHFSLGQIETALADFDSAITLDDRNVTAHLWKGRALVALGRYEEAVPILQRAGELGMQSGVSGVNEGYEAMADAADAIARSDPQAAFSYLAEQVVQFGSRDPLLLGYGRVRWRQGSLSLALNYMDSLVQAGYIPALYWRAAIYAEQGQNEQAIADLQAYLNVRSSGPEAEAARALLASLGVVP